jgi:hypothetical protein
MEIHKPKPTHNLREFLSEVAVVVLGIVIALAGEQLVQSLEWRHRMRLADEQMRQEVAGDDGPQVFERIALSPCVNDALNAIRSSVEQAAPRSAVLEAVDRFWTPRHTWDSVAFQAATSSGVLARASVERVDALSRFYALMPAFEGANEREFHDGAALLALSRAGGALGEAEQERVLGAVEALRHDNAEILRLATLAKEAMTQLGIGVWDYKQSAGLVSPLQVPERVVDELEHQPMAKNCVAELKKSLNPMP